MRAYHFVGARLRDDRPVPPDGEWLEHEGPLKMCASGLHASVHPLDALRYSPGPILCLVEVDGEMLQDNDKVCARRRKIIRRIDATELLSSFARSEALRVSSLWDCPDVVKQYLETGAPRLRPTAAEETLVAEAAAWEDWAGRNAARAAIQAATWETARAAIRDAAWAATRAAEAAAWEDWATRAIQVSIWAAAWVATRAAENVAWEAAQDAARPAVRRRFATLVDAAFREEA